MFVVCQVELAFGALLIPLALVHVIFYGEFDPGSGRTLAACLTHASRTEDAGKLAFLQT